jgi:hypothetical protein
MMKTYGIIVLSAILFNGESHPYTQHNSVTGPFCCVSADATGIVVAADVNSVLYGYNRAGKLQYSQSYAQYGIVSIIDASNALDVFVYFRTSRKLLVLDNQLNLKKELDFNQFQNYQVQGLGRAADGMCWILDARERLIRKLDFTGRTLQTQMIQGGQFPKQFCRIMDNGSSVVIAADNSTVVRVYSSALMPQHQFVKPPESWSLYNQTIYTPLDSNRVLATSLYNGSRDTINTEGTVHLKQIVVYSGGMANTDRKQLAFYHQL